MGRRWISIFPKMSNGPFTFKIITLFIPLYPKSIKTKRGPISLLACKQWVSLHIVSQSQSDSPIQQANHPALTEIDVYATTETHLGTINPCSLVFSEKVDQPAHSKFTCQSVSMHQPPAPAVSRPPRVLRSERPNRYTEEVLQAEECMNGAQPLACHCEQAKSLFLQ